MRRLTAPRRERNQSFLRGRLPRNKHGDDRHDLSAIDDAGSAWSLSGSHDQDAKILIEPKELAEWLARDKTIRLLDVRSREEYEAVHIEGSVLMSQPTMQEILAEGTNTRPLVIIDHQGGQGLDAAAYFMGHGLSRVRCLRGGIDAWSQEVDSKLPRYRLG